MCGGILDHGPLRGCRPMKEKDKKIKRERVKVFQRLINQVCLNVYRLVHFLSNLSKVRLGVRKSVGPSIGPFVFPLTHMPVHSTISVRRGGVSS